VSQTAWYLGCGSDDVGDRALLVGDRGRVAVVADQLDDPVWLNEDRGLTTVTGTYAGRRITVSAFGMGAPIAAVVLHELADLGVGAALRVGTVMAVAPTQMGELVIADGAVRGESTSAAYAPQGYPALADHALGNALRRAAAGIDREVRTGLIASYDGFYPTMAVWRKNANAAAPQPGIVAVDMETSALLVVGRILGVTTGSLCLATVDQQTGQMLAAGEREAGERDLVTCGLEALTFLHDRSDQRSD